MRTQYYVISMSSSEDVFTLCMIYLKKLIPSAANRNPKTSVIKTIATTPTDTDEVLLSSALVFFLIVADNELLFTLNLSIIFSTISSVVKFAYSGFIEKFVYKLRTSLHEHEHSVDVTETVVVTD